MNIHTQEVRFIRMSKTTNEIGVLYKCTQVLYKTPIPYVQNAIGIVQNDKGYVQNAKQKNNTRSITRIIIKNNTRIEILLL